jgi:hypothetical protein
MAETLPLPLANSKGRWAFEERSELGEHGPCFLIYRAGADSPSLPPLLSNALPLLLHEFDRQYGLKPVLDHFNKFAAEGGVGHPSSKTVLRRVLPRLVSYRFVESKGWREFLFEGNRASSVHVLARVLESGFPFRLEDLSHFATYGEHLLGVLNAVGLKNALDPEAILYCPALDSPFPFKFVVVDRSPFTNRQVYVGLLKQLLDNTEKDEEFRSRNFRELTRGFEKFGPAAATPRFQEVELKIWRLLSYVAARLRVKAGRLTDTGELTEVRTFLAELREVHDVLDRLAHLPSRLAALFRRRFDLELSELADQVLPELKEIAALVNCDLDKSLTLDERAQLVSEFRRLGSAAPLECLAEQDRDLKQAYGDVDVPELETGCVRDYKETIFTGAKRFDTRRYNVSELEAAIDPLTESEFELDIRLHIPGVSEDEEEEADEFEEFSSEDWGSEVDSAWDVE